MIIDVAGGGGGGGGGGSVGTVQFIVGIILDIATCFRFMGLQIPPFCSWLGTSFYMVKLTLFI